MQKINARLQSDYTSVSAPAPLHPTEDSCTPANVVPFTSPMQTLTIHLTNAVHDALVAACTFVNRQSPEDPITIAEFTEELIINKVVEMGLLRKKGKL